MRALRGLALALILTVFFERSDMSAHSYLQYVPKASSWAAVWHVTWIFIPRRSITGRLVRGMVLRRHDGRKWIYKKMVRSNDQTD